uniref:Protein hunchback n=1 Tax=Cacopsylla melanoneura TaxID=428564 RepID=A0A8D8TYM5_9HEMI
MFCSTNLPPRGDDLLAHNCKEMIQSPGYPYVCCICSNVSKQVWKFKRHFLVHTKEKNFSCTLCEYRTCYLNDLQKHLRKHTGEKPYKCSLCSYACTRNFHLIAHMRNKHAGEN